MKKLVRNTSDEQSAAFWASVERTAASIKNAPAWMKSGVDVNPVHFQSSEPQVQPASRDGDVPGSRHRVAK